MGNRIVLMGRDDIFFVIAEGERTSDAVHFAFVATEPEQVDAFHRAAIRAGGTDNGAPGLRPQYEGRYYAAFVRDPDGMNIEAVCHLEKRDDDLHHRL